VALHQSFGSIVAEVAEVSIEEGKIRVHRISCAVDCGMVVNPDGVKQQIESAVTYGLSAALFGEITIRDGQVVQKNFHDYPMLRMDQSPAIDVVLIKSDEPPEGVGEPATPPVAPAVANAVFALTGQRLRSLPLRLAAVS
jgi:isoquinoline 1-oxidoreductase beta subunit